MSSDLREARGQELGPEKASEDILRHEIKEGRVAIQRPVGGLFLSGLSAGLDIGFSPFLVAVTRSQFEGVPPRPVAELLVANMAAVGFIFVAIIKYSHAIGGEVPAGGSEPKGAGWAGRW
jgi:hypothetical protein